MAIKNIDQRYPEIGRIRLGDREVTDKGKERPRKGDHLRFTSNDETALKAIASQHGGDVVAWEKGEQAFQLTSETEWIEALLPPDPLADTPIYERWGSGGVQRRCDGERCLIPVGSGDGGHLEEVACACLQEGLTPGDNKDSKSCKVTVRIRLVLPYVPGIGVWLCTSHSWLGALELPGQVAVIEAMRQRGQLIPVLFGIEKRSVKKPWEQYRRDFIVPSVRINQSLAQLQGSGDLMPQLNAVETPPGPALRNPTVAPALPAASAEAPPETGAPETPPAPPAPAKAPAQRRAPIPAQSMSPLGSLVASVGKLRARIASLTDERKAVYETERVGLGLPVAAGAAAWNAELVVMANGLLDEIENPGAPRQATLDGAESFDAASTEKP